MDRKSNYNSGGMPSGRRTKARLPEKKDGTRTNKVSLFRTLFADPFVFHRYPVLFFRDTMQIWYLFLICCPQQKGKKMFDLDDLLRTCRQPKPYEPGAELWNDPHISKRMLEAHLDPSTDLASYRPDSIRSICEFLSESLELKEGSSLIDLGCGPGLYCSRFSKSGISVTGIDRSENSIRYAGSQDARTHYIQGDYLLPFDMNSFDAAVMVSQDYGVLSPENRKRLLQNVRTALCPHGRFAFDVPSLAAYRNRQEQAKEKWYAASSGFWRSHPHFILEKTYFYADLSLLCDFVSVFDAFGQTEYHIFQTFFSQKSIASELEENGFTVRHVFSNLSGEPYGENEPVIGILCERT